MAFLLDLLHRLYVGCNQMSTNGGGPVAIDRRLE